MGDYDVGDVQCVNGGVDLLFIVYVEVVGGFVEEQDVWFFVQCLGQYYLLFLVVGEYCVYVVDQGVVVYWYGLDVIVDGSYLCVLQQLGYVWLWVEEIDVVVE